MGSGPRKNNTLYVAPGVADGITVTCPERFAAVRVVARRSIVAGSDHPLGVDASGSIIVGSPEVVATVADAPETLRIALASGCGYTARFPQPMAEGQIASVEVLLE